MSGSTRICSSELERARLDQLGAARGMRLQRGGEARCHGVAEQVLATLLRRGRWSITGSDVRTACSPSSSVTNGLGRIDATAARTRMLRAWRASRQVLEPGMGQAQ